jgi:CrcB protein
MKPLLTLAAALPGAQAGFSFDTLLINLSGAFVVGLLFGAFEHGAPISPDARLVLGTGFLGSYTTFSSFMVGAGALLRQGQALPALLYLCGAMAAGVALAFAGFTLAGAVIAWRRSLRFAATEEFLMDDDWEGVPASPDMLGVVADRGPLSRDELMADAAGRTR